MTLTEAGVFEEVLHALGVDGVEVELTERDLQLALKDAVRRYSRQNPLRDRESTVITPAGLKTVDIHPETYAVDGVHFQDQLQVLEGRDHISFNAFNSWQIIGAGYGSGGLGDTMEYAVLKQWRDLTRREFSLECDYYFEADQQYEESDDATPVMKKLYFFNPTGLTQNVMYYCVRPRKLSEVNPNDQDWIISWTMAAAKEMLGRKRNKFKTVQSAGQALQLDGADLLDEARSEKEQLTEDLHSRFIGTPTFMWG